MPDSTPFWMTVAASAVAAIVARGTTHPIETVKVRLQTAKRNESARGGVYGMSLWTAFVHIVRHEGLWVLYYGLPTALMWAVPATITYLCTYEWWRKHLDFIGDPDTSSVIHLVAGGMAELVSNIFWCPMEVVKSRQQANLASSTDPRRPNLKYRPSGGDALHSSHFSDEDEEEILLNELAEFQNPPSFHHHPTTTLSHSRLSTFAFMRSLYQRQGLRGFYVGFWLGVLVYLPYSMIYFILYEAFKNWAAGGAPQASLSAWAIMVCAAGAGAVGAAATNPLDVPKTAYQVAADNADYRPRITFLETVLMLWREGGWRAFCKGVGARVSWLAPTVVLQFTVFETVKRWLRG
ncbi:hypothetical protein PhCBS80983_g03930 [Powellomyces hirtus]|uniref:Mitochondrial carrier protein n=1 Tax=Powellomyces hirtus TaxID=109895 RepID=A0A507E2K0_9FUNG|nr:hypothetical protein PhCBS80983_g03930 [Powellomyces hirtus]